VSWATDIQLLNDLHSLVEKCQLFLLDLLENCNATLRIDKLHAVHLVEELYNRVFLFQLLETHHRLFPVVVVHLELLFVGCNYFFIERIALLMLFCVFHLVTLLEINHDLINSRF